jgi:hypothetical protein
MLNELLNKLLQGVEITITIKPMQLSDNLPVQQQDTAQVQEETKQPDPEPVADMTNFIAGLNAVMGVDVGDR